MRAVIPPLFVLVITGATCDDFRNFFFLVRVWDFVDYVFLYITVECK